MVKRIRQNETKLLGVCGSLLCYKYAYFWCKIHVGMEAFHPQQNSEILMTRTVLASVVCRVAVIAAGILGCVFTSYSAFALSLASSSAGYSSLPELNQIF